MKKLLIVVCVFLSLFLVYTVFYIAGKSEAGTSEGIGTEIPKSDGESRTSETAATAGAVEVDPAKVDPKDRAACDFAGKANDTEAWVMYLKEFPNGFCVSEARKIIELEQKKKAEARQKKAEKEEKEKEESLYDEAKKKNTLAAWETYLRGFPESERAFEAKFNKNKMNKAGGLEWSSISSEAKNWDNAKRYCATLTEGGYNDWRLPNIDELRMIVKNRRTSAGGVCKVSEKGRCLDYGCFSLEACAEACGKNLEKCREYDDGRYSRLGDGKVWLWSSSPNTTSGGVWGVDFSDGHISFRESGYSYVRCVREY
ncbi:DUF1566 domain-containing protein [bacterium]|nr:DUF1566 domain-containing protein [bacterium]